MLKEKLAAKEKSIESHDYDNPSEKLNAMEVKCKNLTTKNITLQRYLDSSTKQNDMLNNSSSGQRKFGLGFDVVISHKSSDYVIKYNEYFVRESNHKSSENYTQKALKKITFTSYYDNFETKLDDQR